jgi:hypothetical protein
MPRPISKGIFNTLSGMARPVGVSHRHYDDEQCGFDDLFVHAAADSVI